MSDNVKINHLAIENVKRVKAVKLTPTANGLTIIGGKNRQGKTSVLDSIAWALGGAKYRPTEPHREGSTIPPKLRVELSNGLIVERKGKNSALYVTDPEGGKAGQQLLDSFVEQLALDLPKFMSSTEKEKGDTLLKVIGVGDKLEELEREEEKLYNIRLQLGREATKQEKHAEAMEFFEGVPEEPISATDAIERQQAIMERNAENRRKRDSLTDLKHTRREKASRVENLEARIRDLQEDLEAAKKDFDKINAQVLNIEPGVAELVDESTDELEEQISQIEEINAQVRANLDRKKAIEKAEELKKEYEDLTEKIEGIRQKKSDLLEGADLPLPGLKVEKGMLTYNGYAWDGMSGAEQLKVATAIVGKINPKCGFVLLDKLEAFDEDTLNDFGHWLEDRGLQAIATRVSTGRECQIIIEDGYALEQPPEALEEAPKWKAGTY